MGSALPRAWRSRRSPYSIIDCVARSDAFAGARRRVERDDCLARRDGDAYTGERVADLERGPHRSLGVVLVRDGRAEHRHHGVADVLLERPAEPLELLAHPRDLRPDRGAHVLRIAL